VLIDAANVSKDSLAPSSTTELKVLMKFGFLLLLDYFFAQNLYNIYSSKFFFRMMGKMS
jgi:hypothetical protein